MHFLTLIPLLIACDPTVKDDTTDVTETATTPNTTTDTAEDTGDTPPDDVEPGECLYTINYEDADGVLEYRFTYQLVEGSAVGSLDSDADGTDDIVQTLTYDDAGRIVTDEGLLPSGGGVEWYKVYQYDGDSENAEVEVDNGIDGTIDERLYITYEIDGTIERRITLLDRWDDATIDAEYIKEDDTDAMVLASFNDDNYDGVSDSAVYDYYNASGDTVLKEYDSDSDGVIDTTRVYTYTYGDDGERIITRLFDDGGDGINDERREYTYNDDGLYSIIEVYTLSDGEALDQVIIYDWSACDTSSL